MECRRLIFLLTALLCFNAPLKGEPLPDAKGGEETVGAEAVSPPEVRTVPAPPGQVDCRSVLPFLSFVGAMGTVGTLVLMHGSLKDDSVLPPYKNGHPHIGFGIYFDAENIEATFSQWETSIMENYLRTRGTKLSDDYTLLVAGIFSRKLHGDYDYSKSKNQIGFFDRFNYDGRPVSSFLDEKQKERGVCRHKALILAEMLKFYGMDATYRVGDVTFGKQTPAGHAWVELKVGDRYVVLDPTNSTEPVSRETFYKENKITRLHYPDDDFKFQQIPARTKWDPKSSKLNAEPLAQPPQSSRPRRKVRTRF